MGLSSRRKFGVDLDGVVFAFDIGACVALKLRGNDIEVRESTHWNDIEERVSPAEWKWLWNEGVRSAYEHGPAYPGVPTQLRIIQDLVDIVIITHRPRAVADVTLRKLADMGIRPTEVHHVQGRDKSGVSACDFYVDDKTENVLDLAGTGVPVFTPRKPWNRVLWDSQMSGHQELVRTAERAELDYRPYDNFNEITKWVQRTHAEGADK